MSSDRKDVGSNNEEEDLDGLDDVLDEFSSKPQQSTASKATQSAQPSTSSSDSKPSSSSSAPQPAAGATGGDGDGGLDDFDEEEFARELEANMAALMKTFAGGETLSSQNANGTQSTATGQKEGSPSTGEGQGQPEMNEEEMMKQFEAMMSEMGLGPDSGLSGVGNPQSASTSSNPNATNPNTNSTPTPANYQEALKATMSRLKQSDASASASASGGSNGLGGLEGMFPGIENDEMMKKLMASLAGGADGNNPDGENPEFAQMLENMMSELMGKEVLYEPMKELAAKYQPFLDNPPRPLSDEDKTRFSRQAKIVKEVVTLFEDPKFENGSEEEKRKLKAEVGEKMNEMQECGAPPDEVAGEMPEGMEGIPGLDGNPENCTIM